MIKERTVADDCLVCGIHHGHYFEGVRDEEGFVRTADGWIVIEYTSGWVYLCPVCSKLLYGSTAS